MTQLVEAKIKSLQVFTGAFQVLIKHVLVSYPDCISALLREGLGACFFIDTASAELLPFESKTIAITAYSDMWGEYKDELICEVCAKHSV